MNVCSSCELGYHLQRNSDGVSVCEKSGWHEGPLNLKDPIQVVTPTCVVFFVLSFVAVALISVLCYSYLMKRDTYKGKYTRLVNLLGKGDKSGKTNSQLDKNEDSSSQCFHELDKSMGSLEEAMEKKLQETNKKSMQVKTPGKHT